MKVSNILATRLARRTNNKGLTLIELLVVLVILIALAGILIPQLPGMLTRTHAAAGGTNINEVNKRIQEFEQIYFKQPANLDNLVTGGGALHTFLPNDGTDVAGGELDVVALDAGTAAALTRVGINTVATLNPTGGANATFDNYAAPFATPNVAAALSVARVTSDAVARTLRPGALDDDIYVAFGVGQASEFIGRTASDAGYHFGEGQGENPAEVYARFIAVYKVAEDDGTGGSDPLERAEFVGVLSIHPENVGNGGDHIGEFFETNEL
jgi:prepilin-type N-terminal cleavage/methylation domain-containing protein